MVDRVVALPLDELEAAARRAVDLAAEEQDPARRRQLEAEALRAQRALQAAKQRRLLGQRQ
jgi:hypothetical protein